MLKWQWHNEERLLLYPQTHSLRQHNLKYYLDRIFSFDHVILFYVGAVVFIQSNYFFNQLKIFKRVLMIKMTLFPLQLTALRQQSNVY